MASKTVGPFAIRDTGAPGDETYTTLVLIHGFAWHSGVFSRLLPLHDNNTRVVLINRRDYPGSAPYSVDERKLLNPAHPSDTQVTKNNHAYMKDRARELYDFLHTFAREECIPPTSMIVAGWSLGAVFILALLAHAPLFVTEDKDSLLTKYIRHLVVYDPPYHCLGYAPPPSYYNPVTHDSVNGAKLFPAWVSGYYAHGSSPSALEFHVPLETPPPSVLGMSTDDLESALYNAPAVPGGSDYTLVHAGVDHGLWATIRKAALYPPAAAPDGAVRSSWDEVELRYIWCEQSDWEIPWGAWAFQAEMEEAKAYGRRMRRVSVARLASANHFLHWDQPQRALDALVSCDSQQARTHL